MLGIGAVRPNSAHATVITNLWTGAVDDQWVNSGNWSLGHVPRVSPEERTVINNGDLVQADCSPAILLSNFGLDSGAGGPSGLRVHSGTMLPKNFTLSGTGSYLLVEPGSALRPTNLWATGSSLGISLNQGLIETNGALHLGYPGTSLSVELRNGATITGTYGDQFYRQGSYQVAGTTTMTLDGGSSFNALGDHHWLSFGHMNDDVRVSLAGGSTVAVAGFETVLCIGRGSGGKGELALTAASQLSVEGLTYLGYGGGSRATVTLSGGSTAHTNTAVLAYGGSSRATVVLSGAGTEWVNDHEFNGRTDIAGTASVTVEDGATLRNGGNLNIASGGGATLTVRSGGTVVNSGSDPVRIGLLYNKDTNVIGRSYGDVVVDQGTFQTDGVLCVGGIDAGKNSLTVRTGGLAEVGGQLSLGYVGPGYAVVEGGTLRTLGSSDVVLGDGNSESGTVTQSGGSVEIGGALRMGHGRQLLNNVAPAKGKYELSGTGALAAARILVGENGTTLGTFIQTGGSCATTGDIAIANTLKSDGSSFNITGGSLSVGTDLRVGCGGKGEFTMGDTADVGVAGTMSVGATSTGNAYLNHGTLVANSLRVGDQGSGTFTQTGGSATAASARVGMAAGATGVVNHSGGTLTADGSLRIGNDAGAVGEYRLSADGSATLKSWAVVGYQGQGTVSQSGGTLTVSAAQPMFLAEQPGSTGTYNLSAGTATVNSSLYVGGGLSQGGTGALNLSGGALSVANTLKLWGTGTVDLGGGTLTANTIQHTNGGAFNFTGGTLVVNTFNGNLASAGGTLAPGASPGMTTIAGNYSMGAASTLAMELGGTGVKGTDYDNLNVTGQMSLGGNLRVSYYGGFSPSLGDSFDLLDWGSRAGAFSTVSLPAISNPSLAWHTENLYTTGTIFVGPDDLDRVWVSMADVEWTTAANWNPPNLPHSATNVLVNNGSGAYIRAGEAGACKNLTLGQSAGEAGFVNVDGGSLSVLGTLSVGLQGTGTFTLAKGGQLATQAAVLGGGGGASRGWAGAFDNGTRWTNGGDLTVGTSAADKGDLSVGTGAELVVGGALTVGPGSHVALQTGGTIRTLAFDHSQGTFQWTGGTVAFSDDMTIQAGAGFGGAVSVGANKALAVADYLYVGDTANGSLAVSGGGDVSSRAIVAAVGVGTTGAMSVTGAGSTLLASGPLVVGYAGQSTLDIANGASVSAPYMFLGFLPGGQGAATVNGLGSSLLVTGPDPLVVGEWGTGVLSVENQATVSAQDAFVGDYFAGTLTVTGAHSRLDCARLQIAAAGGNATVTVSDGGTLAVGGDAWLTPRWMGNPVTNVTVTGPGSLWDIGGDLYVAGNPTGFGSGTTTLTVEDGGELRVGGTLKVWPRGTVNLTGGSISAGIIQNTDGGSFTMSGGTLSAGMFNGSLVSTGGTISSGSSPGTMVVDGDFTLAATSTLDMELGGTIQGAEHDYLGVGGALAMAGTLNVIYWNAYNPSQGDRFDILDWGTRTGRFDAVNLPALDPGLAWDRSALYTLGRLDVVTTVSECRWDSGAAPDGNWATAPNWLVDQRPTAADAAFINDGGTATLPAGVSALALSLVLGQEAGHEGHLSVAGGSLAIGQTLDIGPGGPASVAISDGAVTVGTTITIGPNGTLSLTGGSLAAGVLDDTQVGSFAFDGGHLFLTEFRGNLTNAAGTLHPGTSPGLLEILGHYVQGTGAWLEIELFGLAPGTEHDVLSVAGDITLDGGLLVALGGGFTPALGNAFDILDWGGTVSGSFTTLNLPDLGDPDLYWNTSQLYSEGILRVGSLSLDTPEPGSIVLLLAGLSALACRMRRRRAG